MKCRKCGLSKLHGGSAPDRKTYYEMARQSYKSPAEKNLNGWELVAESPTIKIYKSGNEAVISIRGSYDARDAKADSTIAFNSLHLSDRYKEDEKFVSDFEQQNPGLKYYGVGHSLGGAILDLFLHKGLVSEGQSYNPAVQPHDFRATLPVHRIFMSGDPLYTLVKMFLKQTPEVINENTSLFTSLARLTPIGNVATAGEYLKSHGLKQFEGKGKSGLTLHAVIVKKPYDLHEAKAIARDVMKSKKDKFMRETSSSYRFRNLPKTKFSSFVTKVLNPNVSLVLGNLK